jgi:Rieske Fe-S protein
MKIDRRTFVTATAGILCGCSSEDREAARPAMAGQWVDAGPASDYAADGVYATFQDAGFFIVRHGEELFAISAICTHHYCKLRPKPDRSFFCPCHGSHFDPAGHVTRGPATRDLPRMPTKTDEHGRLHVQVVS